MKKLFKIFFLLFLISLAALAFYNLAYLPYQKEKNRPFPEENKDADESQKNRVFAISKEKVLGPAISKDKNHIVYYTKENGNVKQADLDGKNLKTISSVKIENLSSVEWSAGGEEVLCSKISGNKEENYIYSYLEKKVFPFSLNVRNARFSKDGRKIAYNYVDDVKNNISISDFLGKNWSEILNTRINDPIIEWVDNLTIAVYERPSFKTAASILLVDTASLQLGRILSGKSGLSAKFSPDGGRAAFSYSDSKGKELNLAVYDLKNKKEKETGLSSLAEKCAWSQNNKDIFCAIPQDLSSGDLPDRYYQDLFNTEDYFVKINSESGKHSVIFPKISSLKIDAVQPFLSPTEDRLYFVNKIDGKLYGLML